MAVLQAAELAARLRPLIEQECGAGFTAANMAVMEDGHAGLTFGFDVLDPAGRVSNSYVLKLAPMGVARRGNTDVYRQAPLLRALKTVGLPVPAVPWASPDEDLLGTPFIVMERLPGRVFLVWEPHEIFQRDSQSIRSVWLQSARLLAQLHQVDAPRVLGDWEQPRNLDDELAIWPNVLKHAQDPAWLAAGTALGEQLRARMPAGRPVGLVHGDYQPGNILFQDGKVSGLIDWELAFIGAQGLDLGWMMMMSDHAAWDPITFPPFAPESQAEIVAAYREAGGPAWEDVAWYQAMAQYRMGSIACLNVKLHRTGKRHDPLWERFASSIATLFSRGTELVTQPAGR
jgi:aminoglycoside phosphotransferase (APT) family kinase protein